VNEQAVADSTCLIGLERIGRLELLPAPFDPVLAPPAVARELGQSFRWLTIQRPKDLTQVKRWMALVDHGEAEAIALAQDTGLRLIVDDLQARTVARRHGIRIIGAVGLLVIAKKSGFVGSMKPILGQPKAEGFYIGQSLEQEALRRVGELWQTPLFPSARPLVALIQSRVFGILRPERAAL
jgi:uncharacterized protein